MEKLIINSQDFISGEIKVPPSKSFAQRAIALAGLAQNNIEIKNLGTNDDVLNAKNVICSLGAEIIEDNDSIIVFRSIDLDVEDKISINCGESGLATRLFSTFSLLYNQPFEINGSGTIMNRTMEMVIDGLEQFGKKVESSNGKLPLQITGEKTIKTVEIDGSITSQFLTGLLLVAPFLPTDTELLVKDLKSKPYVTMTLDLLRDFGLMYDQKGFSYFYVEGNQEVVRPVEYTVEGDWSAASFFFVAAAINGKIKLTGLKKYSKQPDRRIVDVLRVSGAIVEWEKNDVFVEKGQLLPFNFDATECPDLFPPLVILAAFSPGKSVIKGVHRLINKESNRAVALQKECAKVGVEIQIIEDEMHIEGGTVTIPENIVFSTYNDHRMAMALSLFSLGAKNKIEIENPKAVNKSYPNFFDDFFKVGLPTKN